jgi:cell envelope opacity-associated protein A
MADTARDRIQRASEIVQEQAMQMRDNTSQMFRDQPLIAGALGIAIGAVLGALLPLSRRENELMGETRDQLVDQAMEYGQQTVQQATDAAKDVATAAAEAAKSEAEKQGITGSGGQQESADYKAQSATGQSSSSEEKWSGGSPAANRGSSGTGSASGQYSGDTRS